MIFSTSCRKYGGNESIPSLGKRRVRAMGHPPSVRGGGHDPDHLRALAAGVLPPVGGAAFEGQAVAGFESILLVAHPEPHLPLQEQRALLVAVVPVWPL